MAGQIVTLYIDDTNIRLVVMSGKRVKKWADEPLEPGLVKNGVVVREAEVTARIKQLLDAWNIKTRKIIVGMSGMHCLSRPMSLPSLPAAMVDEAIKREARRVLPVPLEQLYLSWQPIPSQPGKIGVFMVGVPCRTADSLLKTLGQAGLKPYLMDVKPLALAKATRDATCIIVDVQPAEFDIVIMAGGIPQPIRTISLPEEQLSWEDKFSIIRDDLERTITFYSTNNPDIPLVTSIPIYVSGDLAKQPELCAQLSNTLGHPVMAMPSPLPKSPWGFDPTHYMVNLGLALKKLSPGKDSSGLATNLNVLPLQYRPKSVSLTRVIALPSAVAVLGVIVPVVMLIQNTSADVSSLRAQLDTNNKMLQQRTTQRQQLTTKVSDLEKQTKEAEKTDNKFTLVLDNIKNELSRVNGDFDMMLRQLPGGITLTKISHSNGTLTVSGLAPGEQDVLSYLRSLDSTKRFSEISITNLRQAQTEDGEEPEQQQGQQQPPPDQGQPPPPTPGTAREFTITLKSGGTG